ncbi:Eukaryotic translation initiation factor 2 subunit alpha [Sphaceloma murrayae]|uniref:Eukaryotic translation initiation factor 2 subunit alpha n=1 Tax=Sphaceloma murrayae TaxID=2082308 RepID=A0A2K1QP08_9PEZI|nr:Eukaryotic translation initiation factor 2 subunit alpha [Sphaceloma murrayae]
MVKWARLFGFDENTRGRIIDESRSLLPYSQSRPIPSAIPAAEVTKIALRLKLQIESVIPCEIEEDRVTTAHSAIITPKVIETAKSAGKYGSEHDYSPAVVFCLLICKKWFKRQALLELWDSDMHDVRATACEVIAKRIIEAEEDIGYLFQEVLLKRYSIVVDGEETAAANVVEKAVDLHALRVIGSSGYQKCNSYLWRGWLVQDDEDASRFVEYKEKASTDYWVHFDPDRMRVPLYQNALQILISVAYLGLYTGAISTINKEGDLDFVEGLLYIFTAGFLLDEIAKFWKVGYWHTSFWTVFNLTLYALLTISFITRMVALGYATDSDPRIHYNKLSYNFLAFSAPMFWGRLLLYLDTFRFFGAMLVVLKVMMRESLIFFALLIVVLIGFAQAFLGMDQADDFDVDAVSFIFQSLINAIMGSPEFDGFDRFAPPFGLILYYIYNFIIAVILLNILIALFNSAYEDIYENAIDEYMALFSQKTMQFVRAPDENVFIAPFNLIELFVLILPCEWWMSKETYERVNDWVMFVIYSPLLLLTAAWETHVAVKVRFNRKRGEEDEDVTNEWEQMDGDVDFEGEGWTKAVDNTKPNVEVDATLLEVRELRKELKELRELVGRLSRENTPAPDGNGA